MNLPSRPGLLRLAGTLFAGLLPLLAAAQSSITYTPTFTASGINMWGSGVSTASASYFFGTSWNVSGSVGSIAETAIGDFGGRIFGSTSGTAGIGMNLAATAGHVDVNLPYRVTISSPTNLNNPGNHTLNISASLAALPSGNSYVNSTFASANLDTYARVQATATVGGEIAFFDRTTSSTQVLNVDHTIPIHSLNNNGLVTMGLPFVSGPEGTTIPLPPPLYSQTVPMLATPGQLTIAPLALDAASGSGLTTSASQTRIVGVSADLFALASWAAGLPVNPLDTSLNLGPVGFTKRDLSVNVGVNFGLAQDISLTPNLGLILRSSTPLTYSTPSGNITTNALVVTDLTQPISFNNPGGNIAIFPEFFLAPTLRNNTDLLLTGTFALDAATYGYQFFNNSGSLGPLYTYNASVTTSIGLVDSTFNVSGTGLNISQINRSLTNAPPVIGNVAANQNVDLPGTVGNFATTAIAAGGRLYLSAGSLYLNSANLTVAAATADKPGGVIELAAGSGTSVNRMDTPQLSLLGSLRVGAGSTFNVTALNGFTNVNSSGVLSGGNLTVDGTFRYVGPSLTANAANLTLNYTGSLQNTASGGGTYGNALATLAANSGTLTLKTPLNTGRAFSNTGILDLYSQLTTTTFASSGLVFVQPGAQLLLTSPNGFTGVNSSGVLSGDYYLGGQIAYQGAIDNTFPVLPGDTPVYYVGQSITSNTGNLTLSGPSIEPRISNHQPDGGLPRDALATLATNTGNLILNQGAVQSLTQSLTNNGGVGIFDANTRLSIAGAFTNAAGKTLTIRRGTLELDHPVSDNNFTNFGILNLEQGGRIEVDGTLGNFSNANLDNRTGTLTGGTWNVGGTIAYGTGTQGAPNIREIGAGTVINMLGGEFYNQFFNESGLSYLAINRGTLNLGSSYVLKSNASLTNTGTITLSGSSGWLGFVNTLANTGSITIGAGSTLSSLGNKTFDDAGNWTNVSAGGLLSGIGQLVLAGTLEYKGTAITGLAAGSDLTLSGDRWGFFRKTGSNTGVSGLGLTTLGGTLRLANRAKFETPVGATFTVQTGGNLTTSSDSVFIVRQGLLSVAGGATLNNNGAILLQHSGTSPATFGATGNVTLAGTGSLQLTNLATNGLVDAGGTVTNSATHLIAGAGNIATKLVNRGTIESTGNAGLYLQNASPAGLVNSGIIRAGSSITYPAVGNTFDFNQPTVVASPLTIYGTTVTNFEGATAGRLIAASRMWIGVSTVSGGRVEIPSGGVLTLDDAVLTGGVFDLQTGGNVEIRGGRTTLGGTSLISAPGSVLTLLDSGNAADPAILEIAGSQPFLNGGTLVLRNNTRLEGATQFVNTGTVRVDQPGVAVAPVLNSNFRNAAGGTVNIDATSTLRWAGDAFNAGRVNVGPSGNNTAGIAGTLSFPGNSTLSGGGEIRLGALAEQTVGGVTSTVWSASGRLTAPVGTAPVLTNADNTLSGAGTIGDTRLGLINQTAGTVRALGGTLLLNPGAGGVANQGLFRADAGARLEIATANGAFTNFSSGNSTLTGGRYEIAGTFAFPGANIVVNAADLAILGSGRILNSTTNADALAAFATNAAGATLRVQSGAAFAPAGNFTNSGTVVVGGAGALAGGNVTFSAYNGAGALTLADPTARLAFTPASGNTVVSGVLSGSGQLVKSGAGTLVLTGNNSFTGPATISAGTLALGDGTGTTGLITGNIANSGALTFAALGTQTYPGVLSGNGTVAKTGTGNLTLTANNTLTGTVTVSGGNLIFGGSGNLAGNIVNTAGLRFERSDSFIYAGAISGNGTLTKTGAGTLSLTGNIAQANIVISAGTVQIGAGGAVGSLSGNASLTGNLAFDRTGNSTYAGSTSGTGQFSKSGSGNLTVTGNLAHTGGTQIIGGTLEIGAGGTAGSLSGNVTNNATLAFNRSDSLVYGGVVSGNGSLAQRGAGTTVLTGNHTATGGTTISSGTLQLGNGGLTGMVAGNVVNNANLAFSRSDALVYGSVISGSGNVTKLGTSTLTFSANQTYTGNTVVSAGTLQLGNGGTAGSVAGPIVNSGTVIVDRSDALSLSGAISGSGNLVKNGAGTLTLAAANSFSGTTSVNAGSVVLGDSLALQSSTLSLGTGTTLGFGNLTSATLGGLAGSANIVLNNASSGAVALTAGANGASSNYSGNLTGNGTFTKSGNGTLALSGNNVFGGAVTVAGGTLALGTVGSFSADPVVNSGGTLRLDVADALGGRTFAVNGGTVVLNANQQTTRTDTTLTGGTISGPGTFALLAPLSRLNSAASAVSSVVSAPLSFGGSSTFGLNVADGAADLDLVISGNLSVPGSRTFNKVGAGTLQLSGTNTLSSAFSIREGTLSLAGANAANGATLLLQGGNLRADANITGAFTLNAVNAATVNTNAFTLTVGSLIGSGALVKEGTGTFLLTGDSTHSGSLTLSAGTFQLGNGGTTGARAGDVVNNATLAFNRSDAVVFGHVISGTGNVTKLGASSLTFTTDQTYTGTTTISAGTLQLGTGGTAGLVAGNIANSGSLIVNRSDAVALPGVISGTGSLTKSGSNTLTLTGNNTFTGGTTISAGTLQIGDGGLSGSLAGNIANSGTLAYNRSSAVAHAGVISGSGNVTKSGAGNLTLSGNNTFSGGTLISGGAVIAAHNSALGSGGVVLADAAVSFFVAGNATRTVANPITVAAGTASALIGTNGSNASNFTVLTGNIALGRPTTLFDSTASRTSFDGVVSGNVGTLTIGGTTNGRVTLGGMNTFTGNVVVANNVTLQLNASANVTQVLPLASGVDLSTSGRLWIANANTLGSLTGGSGTLVAVASGGVPASTLTVGANDTSTEFAGSLRNGLSGSGALSFTKIGTGTLTLSGNSTYSGATAINAGTLRVANTVGSAFGTSAVGVAAGATLAGAGSFTGPLTLSGIVSPGASPGTLATGSQTWNGGASYVWEINRAAGVSGTNYDLLAISGSLTVAATSANRFTLSLVSLQPDNTAGSLADFNSAQTYSFPIATTTAGITGFTPDAFTLNTSAFANSLGGGVWSLAVAGNNLNLNFTPSAIPEPSTYAALAGLAALAGAVWRRRSRRFEIPKP